MSLKELNKDKLLRLKLPEIKPVCKVMIWEPHKALSVPGIVEFEYFQAYAKDDYHGFCVGQIIQIVAGPGVKLYYTTNMNEATIDYCIANGIRIVNASMHTVKTSDREAIFKKYYDWGGILVAAAGNQEGKKVVYPGSSQYSIAVSATNTPDCNGPEIDITADSWWKVYLPSKITHAFDGTSAATPVITGCIAYILQAYPNWNMDKVKEFLQQNSIPGDEPYERVFSFPMDFGKGVEEVQKTNIVIHHSATKDGVLKDFDAIKKHHMEVNGWSNIGYHWVVERINGILTSIPGRPEAFKGAHCTEYLMNSVGIGICVVGDFSQSPPDDETYWFVAQLCKDIMNRHPIIDIHGHGFYSNTECPGKHFDMEKLKRIIRGEVMENKEKQEVSEWAKEAMEWCMKVGITDGTNPKDTVTREQVWTMLYRAFNKQ